MSTGERGNGVHKFGSVEPDFVLFTLQNQLPPAIAVVARHFRRQRLLDSLIIKRVTMSLAYLDEFGNVEVKGATNWAVFLMLQIVN